MLLAAWLCASSPPVFIHATLLWLGEARHFSHQQRLTAEVVDLLAGQQAHGLLSKASEAPIQPSAPALPAETALKRIDLAVERTIEPLSVSLQKFFWAAATRPMPDTLRAPPPHEPPRTQQFS